MGRLAVAEIGHIDDHFAVGVIDTLGVERLGDEAIGFTADNEMGAGLGGELDPDGHHRVGDLPDPL